MAMSRATLLVVLLGFSALTVYGHYALINTTITVTGQDQRDESLKDYREHLAGTRPFPPQWRMLGIWIVRAGERVTGLSPHVVDFVVKTLMLWASASILFAYAQLDVSVMGALAVVFAYFLQTIVGFVDYFGIYFTGDFTMLACLFGAVYGARRGAYGRAAVLTFVGAWAKETMLIVPMLLGALLLFRRARVRDVALVGVAFAVPTAMLRVWYPAPPLDWAAWGVAYLNIPLLDPHWPALKRSLEVNLRPLVFNNVFWILAALGIRRSRDPFVLALAMASAVYVALAYVVVYVHELRHFLPLCILVLPTAMAELERRLQGVPRPSG